jgi:hypothetical protein
MPNDPKSLWKEQAVTLATYSPDELRARLNRQQRTVRMRNLVEYVAGLLVIVFFAFLGIGEENELVRAGAILVVLGTAVVLWQLHRRASAAPVPAEGDLMAFQRQQLVRQHAALKSVPLWYLGPFAPGLGLLTFARFRDVTPADAAGPIFGVVWIVAVFAGVWLLNHVAARRLARQIETLDRIGDSQ